MNVVVMLLFFLTSFSIYSHEFYDNSGSKCLDIKGGNIQNGNDIIMWQCHGGSNQNFLHDKNSNLIKLANNLDYCLDISKTKSKPDGKLILWRCHGGKNQKFNITSQEIFINDELKNIKNTIKTYDGKCLNYTKDSIDVKRCDSSPNQEFIIPKYCIYEHADYNGTRVCSSESSISKLVPNDSLSSISLVNSRVKLFEHYWHQGNSLKIKDNVSFIGNNFNDKISSLIVDSKRTFLITSDPQLTCGSNCGLSNTESRNNVFNQYKMFSKKYPNAEAVIINGDLTEFGHDTLSGGYEWSDFESAVRNLTIPYYYGLGNHDFLNNHNDCADNNCAIRSIYKLYHHVNRKDNLISFDVTRDIGYKFPSNFDKLTGSLSYSINFDQIVLIQLNDFDKNNNPYKINQYSTGFWGNGAKRYIISKTQDAEYSWLEKQLKLARSKNKIIIFNQHDHTSDAGNLINLLNKYNVKLRFSGHNHFSLGAKTLNGFYRSGSTARGTYLKLDINTFTNKAVIYTSDVGTDEIEFYEEIQLERNEFDKLELN